MRLRRAAFVIPTVRGALFGTVAALALLGAFTLKGPEWSFVPFALFVYSIPFFALALVYTIAAILLAKRWVVWRSLGALLDVAPSLLIAWALVVEVMALPRYFPLLVPIAAVWACASIPVVVGAFQTDARLEQVPGL